ncbi:hypothetical protein EBZ35_03295, partial [bacterium]|nr:hypothetical protein [bacterium]
TIMALRQQASNRPNGQKKQPAIDQVTNKELETLIKQFSHNKWVQPKKIIAQQKADLVRAKEVATLIKHFSDNGVNPEPTSTQQKIECLAYLLDPTTELGRWLKPSHHYQVSMLGMMSGIYEKIATDQTIQTISEKDRDTLSRIQNELTNKMLTCQLPAEPVMVILKGHRTLGHTVTTSDQEQLIKTLDARTIIQAHDDLFPTQAAYHQWINQQLSTINQIEAVPVWDAEWARCISEAINSNPGNPTHQHLYQFVENAIKEKPDSLDWITPIHWDIVQTLWLLRTVWTTYPNQWDLAMQPLPTEKVASIQTGLRMEFGSFLSKRCTASYPQLEPVVKHFFSVLLGFRQPLDPDIFYILREVLNAHERATPQLTSQIQQHIQQDKITQPLLQCLMIFQPFKHTPWYSPEVNPLCDADHPNDRIPNWIKKRWDEPINPLIPTCLATDNPVMAKQDAIMGFMITYLTINPQSPAHPQLKTIIQSLDDNQKSQLLSQLPIPSIVKYWEQLFSDKEQYRTWMQKNINRPTVPPVYHRVEQV